MQVGIYGSGISDSTLKYLKRILGEHGINHFILSSKQRSKNVDCILILGGDKAFSQDVGDMAFRLAGAKGNTVMEKLLDEISFTATDRKDENITINADYVRDQVAHLAKDTDLSKFIL